MKNTRYCNSLTTYSRFSSRVVNIGEFPLGGDNPIRIQSMTNTNTLDTEATVEQCIRIFDAGADYVRIAAPLPKDAENLKNIKDELLKRGYNKPLIADIHYSQEAALIAAKYVEKIRINPGNYSEKSSRDTIEYSEIQYNEALEKLRENFLPLIEVCKANGTAMRIGTNHGSLGNRIVSRFGDTPLGMVEATLEFLRICVKEEFFNVVVSLKSSNTLVMIEAYRLMINRMLQEEMDFPLHLGVTEAGEGEDGRIKSALGIGTLLADGIGDTIRVSLTEEPEKEIVVAKKLVCYYNGRTNRNTKISETWQTPINPFEFNRRKTVEIAGIGGNNPPCVIIPFTGRYDDMPNDLIKAGYKQTSGGFVKTPQSADFIHFEHTTLVEKVPENIKLMTPFKDTIPDISKVIPEFELDNFLKKHPIEYPHFLDITNEVLTEELLSILKESRNTIIICDSGNDSVWGQRKAIFKLMENDINLPVIIRRLFHVHNEETLMVRAASEFGFLLADGICDGIWIMSFGWIPTEKVNSISFCILQAARARTSRTEYISCPSCGRTHFNLTKVTAAIRQKTSHLKNLKIAIMGCIVNGPGEMADADYGYVGTGQGKITLYKKKEVIKRNIPEEYAVNELIDLIKQNNDWIENIEI